VNEDTRKSAGAYALTANEAVAVDAVRKDLVEARTKGKIPLLKQFVKLSGPGWFQSAITLGSGTMGGALYLGVIGGVGLMWVQPLAMIMGVIMLSAISYVTLATEERPFRAIIRHVNPVMAWGWIIATLLANMVWTMPQYGFATSALRQNLLPGLIGATSGLSPLQGQMAVIIPMAILCILAVIGFDRGLRGMRVFEIGIKLLVGLIVISFVSVVAVMGFHLDGLDWGAILAGFRPGLSAFREPSAAFVPHLVAVPEAFRSFWADFIVAEQRQYIIAAGAVAVGINMTFMLPYSMLKKGWNRDFRGLAIFDLSTGLFIPFIIVTACIVIASAQRFHAVPAPGLLGETNAQGELIKPSKGIMDIALRRVHAEMGATEFDLLGDEEKMERVFALPEADRRMAAMLVRRDAVDLAQSLAPLTGDGVAHIVFGLGILGMAVSTAIMLMMINGFVICEVLNVPSRGRIYLLGAMLPVLSGVLSPFLFTGQSRMYLSIPTSLFANVFLPIAYFTFLLMMNQPKLLGKHMPRGAKRIWWNTLMLLAASWATAGSVLSLTGRMGVWGYAVIPAFIALAVVVHFIQAANKPQAN